MKILFVTHYYEPDSGAAANRLTRLAKQLGIRGHDVTILTTMPHYPQGTIPKRYRRRFVVTEQRVNIRVIQVWLYTSPSPKVSRRLLSQLSFMITCTLRGLFVKHPDVMLIENQPIFTALAGWIISRFKRVPYIANVSDFWPEYLIVSGVTTENSHIYKVFRAITNLTQRQANGIVALYPPLLTKIEERLGEIEKSKVIYNAIDFEKFYSNIDSESFREKYNLEDKKIISFLGVLGGHIDLETMLSVARYFHDYDDVRFLFVGTGQQKDKLEKTLQDLRFSHCRWISWIDSSEVPSFWAASYLSYWAIHVNPLDQMRFQAKLYEAMASGTPVVIGVKGLMRDILQESNAGIATSPGNVQKMIEAITQLLEDKELYSYISKNGRQFAEEHYNLERHVDEYETILQQIASSDTKR